MFRIAKKAKGTPKDLRFFKVILSSIADGVFTVESNRVITSFNPAAEKISGMPAMRAICKRCFKICEEFPVGEMLKISVGVIDRLVNIIDNLSEAIATCFETTVNMESH